MHLASQAVLFVYYTPHPHDPFRYRLNVFVLLSRDVLRKQLPKKYHASKQEGSKIGLCTLPIATTLTAPSFEFETRQDEIAELYVASQAHMPQRANSPDLVDVDPDENFSLCAERLRLAFVIRDLWFVIYGCFRLAKASELGCPALAVLHSCSRFLICF